MRRSALLFVCTIATAAATARAQSAQSTFEVPAWAFPLPAPVKAAPLDSVTPLHLPHSTQSFTAVQVRNQWDVPDWYPAAHRAMPNIVQHGRRPAIIACGFCHLPDGSGRPENATLAGLPAAYITQQVADIKSRARQSAWHGPYRPMDLMKGIADSLTGAEIAEAARYFSGGSLKRRGRVVEATDIPRVSPALGLYFPSPEGGTEPLGKRLIEVAVDPEAHERRDAAAEYVTYVPPGTIARGKAIATRATTRDGVKSCTNCHGPRLRGVALVPPIAGRSPSYILRQLVAFRTGARSAPASAPMRDVVAGMELDDMIAAAAYAGSRRP